MDVIMIEIECHYCSYTLSKTVEHFSDAGVHSFDTIIKCVGGVLWKRQ